MLKSRDQRFRLTPFKLLLLSVIKAVYKGHHKILDAKANSEEVSSQKQQKEVNLLTVLKLIGHIDEGLPLSIVYKYIEERDKAKPSLLAPVIQTLSSLITNGTEGLTELLLDCDTILLEETNGSVPISRNSIVGLFLRSTILAFHKLTFSEKVKCIKEFRKYYGIGHLNEGKVEKAPSKLTPILQKANEGFLSLAVSETHSTFDRLQGENINSKLPDKMGQGLLVLAKIYEQFGLINETAYSAREALISGQEFHTNPLIEEAKKMLLLNGIVSPKQLLQLRPTSFVHDKSGVFSVISKLLSSYKDKAKLISILSCLKDRKHTADSRIEISKLWNISDQYLVATLIESILLIVPPSGSQSAHKNSSTFGRSQLLSRLFKSNTRSLAGKVGSIEDEMLKVIASVSQMGLEGQRMESLKLCEDISALLPNRGALLRISTKEGLGCLESAVDTGSQDVHVGLLSDEVSVLELNVLLAKHSLLCGNYGNSAWRVAAHSQEITSSSDVSQIMTLSQILNGFNLPMLALQTISICKANPCLSLVDSADLSFEEVCLQIAAVMPNFQSSMFDFTELVEELEKCAAIYDMARRVFKLKEVYFMLAAVHQLSENSEGRNCAAKRFRDLDELHGNLSFAYVY